MVTSGGLYPNILVASSLRGDSCFGRLTACAQRNLQAVIMQLTSCRYRGALWWISRQLLPAAWITYLRRQA